MYVNKKLLTWLLDMIKLNQIIMYGVGTLKIKMPKKIPVDFMYHIFIKENTDECKVSERGGKLVIDVSSLFPSIANPKMMAYQNYLGGGIAGKIMQKDNFTANDLTQKEYKEYLIIRDELKLYFYNLNAGGGDDYMVENVNNFQQNQTLPESAY